MQLYTIIFILLSVFYMFQAVFPPIIRSSKNRMYSIGYCQAFLLPTLAWVSWNNSPTLAVAAEKLDNI